MTLNGKTILVVAGGYNFGHLDSVEKLIHQKIMSGLQVCILNYSRTLFNKYIPVEFLLNKSHFIFQDQICLWDYMDMQW